MQELLLSTHSGDSWPANASRRLAETWLKIRFHLLWNVLPTLLMVAVLGGLTLTAAAYLDRHRPDQQIALVSAR